MIVYIILAFIAGLMLGLKWRSKQDTEDLINSFAETQRIRDENKWLHDRLCNGPDHTRVVYICDGKACPECVNPDCHHTFDITHARNFECIAENEYWEKEEN